MRRNMASLVLFLNSQFRARPPDSRLAPSRGLEWLRKFAAKAVLSIINYLQDSVNPSLARFLLWISVTSGNPLSMPNSGGSR